MIPILCNSCDVHVYDLDQLKLAWPLRFDMFVPVMPNNRLPSGPVTTDTYCPVCMGPWLHWDSGDGVMGKYLKVRVNGYPTIIKTSDLIAKWEGVPRPELLAEVESVASPPAPTLKKKPGPKPKQQRPGRKPRMPREINVAPPELKELMARVEGKEGEDAALTASPAEFVAMKSEMERERHDLARRNDNPNLRPASGR